MQTNYSSPIPPYFLNIEFKEGEGYIIYACKDTGRKNKLTEMTFKTYAEAKKFCQKHASKLKIMTV